MLRSILVFLLSAVFAATLAGCAGGGISQVVKDSPTAELTVKYAVIKLIDQSKDVTPERVIKNVQRARSLLQSDAAISIAGLSVSVRENINWQRLSAADSLLLDQLLSEAERRLTERVGDGLLDHDHRVLVSQVLQWIEAAANLAAPRSQLGRALVHAYEYVMYAHPEDIERRARLILRSVDLASWVRQQIVVA